MTALYPARREELDGLLAEHVYELGRGQICRCGFVPDVDPSSLLAQQDYHRSHQSDALAPLIASWLAEARADGAAEVRARVEAALDEKVSLSLGLAALDSFKPPPRCPNYAHVNPDWLRALVAEAVAIRAALAPPDTT